jgi:hypothetical protein
MMFFTKYALSDKIQEVEVVPSMYAGYAIPAGLSISYKIGKHLHHTREDAVKAACGERDKKIASLQKQIEKLKKLEF